MKSIIFFTALSVIGIQLLAQDTTKHKSIQIISSFKPTLKSSSKIDFNPSALNNPDTTRPRLLYTVPVQNLSFNISPATLKPAALQPDSGNHYANNGYLKAGFGTFSTPYLDAAVSFGDGKKSSGAVHAGYSSSKGNLPFQKYSLLDIDGNAQLVAGPNTKLDLGASAKQFGTYYYGYQPTTGYYTADQLQQRYSTYNVNASLSNNLPTSFGLLYSPTINLWLFNDINDGKETHLNLKAPFEIALDDKFKFGVELQSDLVKYDAGKTSVSNNLFSIIPSVSWHNDLFLLKAGLMPSWNNNQFNMLPDIEFETKPGAVQTNNETINKFIFLAGWKGYYDINSYRNLATYNPWIAQPSNIFNTRNTEFYAGLKSSSGDHFSYMARIGYVSRNNVALFQNDSTDGRTFKVLNEAKINTVKLQAELSYQQADQFFWKATFIYQTFGGFQNYDHAYGLVPLEINSNLRYKLFKNFDLIADLYYFDGNRFRTKTSNGRTKSALDLNAGVEYKVVKNISVWLQFNNVLNSTYQRWNQYDVLGFQALIGAKVSF